MFKFALLGLLVPGERHGYQLRARFERFLSGLWPVNVGQVYTTLARLERDGLVESAVVEQDDRPDRRVYWLTDEGRDALDQWLREPAPDAGRMKDEFFLKLLVHWLASSGDARALVNDQRQQWYESLAELTERRIDPDTPAVTALVLDGAILRLEADLRWLDAVDDRLPEVFGAD